VREGSGKHEVIADDATRCMLTSELMKSGAASCRRRESPRPDRGPITAAERASCLGTSSDELEFWKLPEVFH
jgi:hypothetical protein